MDEFPSRDENSVDPDLADLDLQCFEEKNSNLSIIAVNIHQLLIINKMNLPFTIFSIVF